MGARLVKAFEIAKQAGGVQVQMRLAMKTAISGNKAATEPDSPENIKKMEAALKELIGKDVRL